jgi:hypothetical protein
MAKKVKQVKTNAEVKQVKAQEAEHQVKVQAQVHEAEAPKTEAKVTDKATARATVKALQFLRKLHLDWVLERPLEEGDLDMLKASVQASVRASKDGTEEVTEWASWWMPYTRADGSPVKGLAWSVAAPMTGGYIVLRLIEDRAVKATMRVWPSGKGTIRGVPAIVQALASRPDLPEWTDKDLAALL